MRLSRPPRSVAIVMGLLLMSCSPASESSADGGSTSTAPPVDEVESRSDTQTSSVSATGGTTQPSAEEVRTVSPLRRREAPPQGIPAQLELYVGSEGGSCGEVTGVEPSFGFSTFLADVPIDLRIGFPQALCVQGFEPDLPILVDILGPDGQEWLWEWLIVTANPDDGVDLLSSEVDNRTEIRTHAVYKWTPQPGIAFGEYTVSARQDSIETSSSFTVERPSHGIAVNGGPLTSSDGGEISVLLSGYAPGSAIPMHLYVSDSSGTYWSYITSIETTIGSDPDFHTAVLFVEPGDPPGYYCIVTDETLADAPEVIRAGFEHLLDPCFGNANDFTVLSQ